MLVHSSLIQDSLEEIETEYYKETFINFLKWKVQTQKSVDSWFE
jgi:hypothetical protein